MGSRANPVALHHRRPEGIEKFDQTHPDVPVFACAVGEHLNQDAYIVPGLGDAGDKIFGTK